MNSLRPQSRPKTRPQLLRAYAAALRAELHRRGTNRPLIDSTILDAIAQVWPAFFRDVESWAPWFTFLRTLFGLPLSSGELALFQQCTGLTEPPRTSFSEAWLVCGRRGGKSRTMALIAVFLACFREWRPYLSPGERGLVTVLATDRRQARVIFRYATALIQQSNLSEMLVKPPTAEAIDLNNEITIEIHVASFRSVRGYTLVAALCDEIAFWQSEDSANPDEEILGALRPAMATIPGAMLLCASSPYARRGALWSAYRDHYGKESPVLVWHADTKTMNPSVPDSILEEAYHRDPAAAAAEYGAQFRVDVEAFITRELVESVTCAGRHELPRNKNFNYIAFVDPSGGSADSMTLAIAHGENGKGVLDVIRERRPPFSPDDVVQEFGEILRAYQIYKVSGDRYAGEWPRERFSLQGISYEPTEKTKSQIYIEMMPLVNSGRVELLDNTRLMIQLVGLERRSTRGGRDTIDHIPGGHDDVANAVAGALVEASGGMDLFDMWRRLGGFPGAAATPIN